MRSHCPKTLGAGFLEKAYENTLAHALTKAGLRVRQQIAIGVEYDGVTAGAYVADLSVENAREGQKCGGRRGFHNFQI